MDLIRSRLEALAPKVANLGVGLGLETAGRQGSFGTLGDIALLASEFPFVRPVIDWAHLHALSGGGLIGKERFRPCWQFLRDSFPAWMLSPLHTHFTDNRFGPGRGDQPRPLRRGEPAHRTAGGGGLRGGDLDGGDLRSPGVGEPTLPSAPNSPTTVAALERKPAVAGRQAASGRVAFPDPVAVEPAGERFRPTGARRSVSLSNLVKPFFPDGYTKGDLISYYASVADTLLPHLRDRPLSMSRYPDGIEGPSFYEKRAPGHQPGWMRTLPVGSRSMGGEIDFLCADHRESLLWFANMGCVEVHPFHSRHPQLPHPDWAVFDFDPAPGASWSQVGAGVKLLGVALERLGLRSFPKLSGSRGMHVYLPLRPGLLPSAGAAVRQGGGRRAGGGQPR